MPRLPDPYDVRQAPRFGQPLQAPKFVEPVDEGAGLRALAQGVKGLSDEIEKAQIKNDKYATMDALTRLEEAVINNRAGENGWQHKKAADVSEGFFKDESDRFTQTSDEIGSTLTTPNSIEDYNRRAAVIGNRVKGNLINHATAEKEVANTNTFNATVLLNREAAANNYAIPAEVKLALLNTREAIELRADDLGIDGDAKDLMLKAHASSIHAAVIMEAVDNNNSKYGQIWLDKNRKDMMDEDIDDVEKLLKDGNSKEMSQEVVDDYFDRSMTQADMNKETRDKYSGQERDDILTRTAARWGEEKASELEGYRVAGENAYEIYNNAIDNQGMTAQEAFDSIPQSVRERMSQKALSAMRRMVEMRSQSQSVHTKFDVLDGLLDLAGGKSERGEYADMSIANQVDTFKSLDLNEYIDSISTTHLLMLAEMQRTDEKRITGSTENELKKNALSDIGLDKKDMGKDNKNGRKIADFFDRFSANVQIFQNENKRPPDNADKKDILDNMSIEIIREGIFNKSLYAGVMTIPGIETNAIDDLAGLVKAEFDKRGIERKITESDIINMYRYLNGMPLLEEDEGWLNWNIVDDYLAGKISSEPSKSRGSPRVSTPSTKSDYKRIR